MAVYCVDPRTCRGAPGEAHAELQNQVGAIREFSDGNLYGYYRAASPMVNGDAVTTAPGGAASRTASPTSFGPVAWATATLAPTEYGWFFVAGAYPVRATDVVMDAAVYATATPGVLDDTVVATNRVHGAVFRTAGSGVATIQVGPGGAFLQSDL